jgi:hypothetical protein
LFDGELYDKMIRDYEKNKYGDWQNPLLML